MKRVVDLIEQAPACPVIRLDDGEKDIYNGAGLMLARFIEGTLVELHDPTSVEFQEDDEAMAEAAIKGAIDWIESTTGEHWLVLCSGYELCEPRQLTHQEPSSYANMARLIAERVIEGL
ncbi:MAG: hypothetical protein LW865_01975 [Betaproteobacteria bacterium]|nr:hypothetical protein [Betaproteobacteria bacterium]